MEAIMPVKLKTIYEKKRISRRLWPSLYLERNGKFELTGIEGVKTQADVDRVQEALRKEKTDHKTTKESLAKFGDLDPEKVPAALEELEEVKAQLATATKDGKVDEGAVQERIEAAVNRAVGPLQRDKKSLETQLANKDKVIAEKDGEVSTLQGSIKRSKIEGILRDNAIAAKVIPTAIDDAVMVGLNMFEEVEGKYVTKDGSGITPGLEPKEWYKDMQEKRPHWWPPSQGGGSRGGGAPLGRHADNPWSAAGWNITNQGKYITQHGEAKAAEAARSVGSKIGATKPPVQPKRLRPDFPQSGFILQPVTAPPMQIGGVLFDLKLPFAHIPLAHIALENGR
jgi:hypothetical protein